MEQAGGGAPGGPSLPSQAASARPPRRRDRRGRGMRGPGVVPRVPGSPERHTAGERFDRMVLDVVSEIDERWSRRLGTVEYAVEDAPQVPDDWHPETVPLSSLVRGVRGEATRLVLFRRPIEHRVANRTELEALVLTLVVEQVAELLGVEPETVDPRYRSED